jgi:hypothetical protein
MNRLAIYLFCALSVFGASCEGFFSQVVEIDPPEYEKSLVFHQLLSDSEDSVRLLLSRNYGILEVVPEDKKWFVSGATVEWWSGGQKALTLSPLSVDSAFVYVGKLPAAPQPGQTYEIRVSHPDYLPVRAEQQMPQPTEAISDVKLSRNVSSDQYGTKLDELEVSFKDVAGVAQYYEMRLIKEEQFVLYQGQDSMGNWLIDTIRYEANAYFENTFDPNIVLGYNNTILLSDRYFDGATYKFRGRFYAPYSEPEDPKPYIFILRSVSKEYYFWSKSYQQSTQNQGNPFVEPVSVYNNLENGLGIFGLYSERRFEVQ